MARSNAPSKGNKQKFKTVNSSKMSKNGNGQKQKVTKIFANKMKNGKQDSKIKNDNKKINYVLHPRLLKQMQNEAKESERNERQKLFQMKKRKRNAIYMKTTDKGQPKLNARMKILYDQIARSCENT